MSTKKVWGRVLGVGLAVLGLRACFSDPSLDVGNNMTFAYHNSRDYTNLYLGDGTVPVLPGGCDAAKWNDRYVLTRGEAWRYTSTNAWHVKWKAPTYYFVVDTELYGGGQEGDPAVKGPLTEEELAAWNRRIPGSFRTL